MILTLYKCSHGSIIEYYVDSENPKKVLTMEEIVKIKNKEE